MTRLEKLEQKIKELERRLCCKTQFFDTYDDFPDEGSTGVLYIDEETGNIYIWDGVAYSTADAAADHGSLTGLGDDDHTQYALLAGRATGQTINGGTAANEDITIEGTSHATKTTSCVILQPTGGNVGVGTVTPENELDVNGSIYIRDIDPMWGFITTYGKIPIFSYPIGDDAFIGPKTGNLSLSDIYGGTSGARNIGVGNKVLYSLTTGHRNLGLGFSVMSNLTIGTYNTIVGMAALDNSIDANHNSGLGHHTLRLTTTGSFNVTLGNYTLEANTTGERNVAIGHNALKIADTNDNVAIGYNSGVVLSTGSSNTAIGSYSLSANTTGQRNVVNGTLALASNTLGSYSSATGFNSLTSNISGNYNTAYGYFSGYGVTGSLNILIGASSIAASYNQVTTGSNNISIGSDVAVASATASNQLCIGNLIYGTGLSGTGSTVSTGNIGIGTIAPNKALEINSATGANLRLTYNDANGSATNYADLSTTSLGNLVITPSGGYLTFTGNFDVTGATTLSGTTFLYGSYPELRFQSSGNKWGLFSEVDGAGIFSIYGYGAPAGTKMVILPSGNIGIGTTSPSAKLHIIGTTEQQRTGYDVSNYLSTTINSTGSATFNLVGTTPTFTFSDPVIADNLIRLKGYTVATLPVTAVQGDTAFVTDLLGPTYLVAAVGGGAVVGPVFYNGAAWVTS